MRNYKFEVDLDAGTERMESSGLNLQQILALVLRPISLLYARLSKTRPGLAQAFRLKIYALVLDPESPVWQISEFSTQNDTFAVVDMSNIGGDK